MQDYDDKSHRSAGAPLRLSEWRDRQEVSGWLHAFQLCAQVVETHPYEGLSVMRRWHG